MSRGAIALGAIAFALAVAAAPPARGASFLPGEIVVRFRDGAPAADRLRATAMREPGVRSARATFAGSATGAPVSPSAAPPSDAAPPGAETPLRRTLTLDLEPGVDPEAAARAFRARADVEFAAPIRLLPLLATFQPDDPELPRQWHHAAIGSPAAWGVTPGDSSVVIAIVDTGIDLEHPDLAPNLWVNRPEENGLPGVDDDGNGWIDDRHGFDFTDVPEVLGAGDFRDRDPDPNDDIGHGTWVAGMAAAAGDNGVGGAGVAWGCRVMPLRAGFLPRTGFALGFLAEDDAAAAILYAVDNGADVVNLSFGDLVRAPLLEEAVRYAVERGVIVVAAAGNNGDDAPFYPAGMAGVLAVGASTSGGARAAFSTYGPAVLLLAPGSQVLTTERGGGMTSKSGTSLASPVAAGAAALLRGRHPEWPAARIIAALIGSATPVTSGDGRGAALLRLDRAIGTVGDVVVALHGLDDGSSVADTLRVVGTAAGGKVRGWRLLARPVAGGDWRTLGAATSRQAFEELLATWSVVDESEADWILRLEAFGLDQVLGTREARVAIDRTPPVVTEIEVLPALSGAGYGIRASARASEPVFGRLVLRRVPLADEDSPREFRAISATERPIVGLDSDLPGGPWQVDLSWRDGAGNTTTRLDTVHIPEVGVAPPPSGRAPSAATWLRRLVDLDGDGTLELVGESWDRRGGFYGRIRAWRPQLVESNTCTETPGLAVAWTGTEAFIPRDFGDFDGDGRGDLLGQGLQSIRVVGSSQAGNFPDQVIAASDEAWAARFVPSSEGSGLDIVASRDSEIRLYRRGDAALDLASRLVNPTAGLNAISPAIEVLARPGGGVGLATIDSDGDLLIAERLAADFEWTFTERRFEAGSTLGAVDVDGDGVSELAVLESVGEIPSPAAGLRDGYFRLTLLERRAAREWSLRQVLGVAGHFPGNPAHVQGVPTRGEARDALWVGAGGRLWRLVAGEGSEDLRPVGVVTGVGDGPLAWGFDSAIETEFVVFPSGDGAADVPEELCFGPMIREAWSSPAPRSAVRGVRARARERDGGVDIELRWSELPDRLFRVQRWPVDAPEEIETLADGLEVASFVDTTSELNRRYRYLVAVVPADAVEGSTIELIVRPRNPVVSAAFEAGLLQVEWTDPVRLLETASVEFEDGLRFESLHLVADGRRLVASPAPESRVPSGSLRLHVRGVVSATGLDLSGADASFTIEVVEGGDPFRLVRAWPIDPRTIGVELAPGVPLAAIPLQWEVVGGPEVVATGVTDARTLRLDLGEALTRGDYQVRLRVGGEIPGEVPLRVSPVVYPNPVRPGGVAVRFDWLAADDEVRIVDLSGREIWTGRSRPGEALEWPVTRADGRPVAPGIYLFHVRGSWPATGKIAVLR